MLADLQAQVKTSTLDHEKVELDTIKAEILGQKGAANNNEITALNGVIENNTKAFDVEYLDLDKNQAEKQEISRKQYKTNVKK